MATSARNAGLDGWMLHRMSEAAWAELGVASALVQGKAVSVFDRAQYRPERDEAWSEKHGGVPGPASGSDNTASSLPFCLRPTSSGRSTDFLNPDNTWSPTHTPLYVRHADVRFAVRASCKRLDARAPVHPARRRGMDPRRGPTRIGVSEDSHGGRKPFCQCHTEHKRPPPFQCPWRPCSDSPETCPSHPRAPSSHAKPPNLIRGRPNSNASYRRA